MSMGYRKHHRRGSHTRPEIGWPVLLIIGLIALVLALPALASGIVLQRLTSTRTWSFPLWFALSFLGAGLIYYLWVHGLERMITVQLTDYVVTIKKLHVDIVQVNIARLWSETWTVWIRTLALTPIIAFFCALEASGNGDSAKFLQQREAERQRHVTRSKSRAIRKARHPERIPDAVKGQMMVGVSMDDEHCE
jgi:hypothetical protein